MIVRQINSARPVTVASPAYWDRHGKPTHPSELIDHSCISYSLAQSPTRWEYLSPSGGMITVRAKSRVLCNSAELECSLALAGLGVTRLPEFACARELAQGTLEIVLQEFAPAPLGIHAVYPHRRHLTPKVRAFVDFLAVKFAG